MNTKIIIAILAVGLFTNSMMLAQEKTDNQDNHKHMGKEQFIYTCSMHPEVKSNKSGECPKCGMAMVKMKENHENMSKMYTCSMHPDVKSDKAGACPKCGMALVKMQKNHEDMSKIFTCSMHPEVKSDMPGECPKCGMTLVEKKMDKKEESDLKKAEHKH
jgi:ssDNA-binding Zn-finger/Zn-ribbon topoisomerase 1